MLDWWCMCGLPMNHHQGCFIKNYLTDIFGYTFEILVIGRALGSSLTNLQEFDVPTKHKSFIWEMWVKPNISMMIVDSALQHDKLKC